MNDRVVNKRLGYALMLGWLAAPGPFVPTSIFPHDPIWHIN